MRQDPLRCYLLGHFHYMSTPLKAALRGGLQQHGMATMSMVVHSGLLLHFIFCNIHKYTNV